jgi:hypothetical protein
MELISGIAVFLYSDQCSVVSDQYSVSGPTPALSLSLFVRPLALSALLAAFSDH